MADAHLSSQENNPADGRDQKIFNDEEVTTIEICNIYDYTRDEGLEVWENIFRSLENGITKQGMLQLISLACHIQNRAGEPLMKLKSSSHRTQPLTDGTYLIRARTTLSWRVQEPTRLNQDQDDAETKFSAVCYFAACLMKLVTDTPDKFMRGLPKIKQQYLILYRNVSAYINSIKFERSMAEHISLAFRKFPVFKHTIVHHVAIADAEHRGNQQVIGLLLFACVQRLQFHGMKVFPQYADLINRLTLLSPPQYLTWLRCPHNNAALNMLCHITVNYACPKEDKTPSLFWKYARIFDSGYFKALEQESCKYLLATQAYLSIRYCHLKESDTPLNIGVIKNDPELLSWAKLMADEFKKAYDNLAVHLGKAGPVYKRSHQITDEGADECVRTYNLLSFHFEENGPLWKSINRSKTELTEDQLMTKMQRIQQNLPNSPTRYRPGTEKFATDDMEIDELVQRMKARHLKKKTLSLGGPSTNPEVSAGGSSIGATPDRSAPSESAASSKRTPSPALMSIGGSLGSPVVAGDSGAETVEAEIIVEEVAPPLKRRREDDNGKGKQAEAEEEEKQLSSYPIYELCKLAGAERVPSELPPNMTFNTGSLDSFWYKDLDLTSYVQDRMLLPNDHQKNAEIINYVGATKFGQRAVTQLARGFSDVLSLLPAMSTLEKTSAKFKNVDTEALGTLQDKLDKALGELRSSQEELEETNARNEAAKQEIEGLRADKAEAEKLAGGYKAEKEKVEEESRASIHALQEQLSAREKELAEVQSSLSKLQEDLDKADDNLYDMYLKGFEEAKEQVKYFNPLVPIDFTQVSDEKEVKKLQAAAFLVTHD